MRAARRQAVENPFKSLIIAVFLKERQTRDRPVVGMINVTTRSNTGLEEHGNMVKDCYKSVQDNGRVHWYVVLGLKKS